jgi:hypothetical protein
VVAGTYVVLVEATPPGARRKGKGRIIPGTPEPSVPEAIMPARVRHLRTIGTQTLESGPYLHPALDRLRGRLVNSERFMEALQAQRIAGNFKLFPTSDRDTIWGLERDTLSL